MSRVRLWIMTLSPRQLYGWYGWDKMDVSPWMGPLQQLCQVSSSPWFTPLHSIQPGGHGASLVLRILCNIVYCRYTLYYSPPPLVHLSNPASASPSPHVTDDKDIISGDKVATDYRAELSIDLSLTAGTLFISDNHITSLWIWSYDPIVSNSYKLWLDIIIDIYRYNYIHD